MGRPAGWMKQLTGRDAMRSPGAPSHRREVERQFWVQVATGITSEKAAEAVGVSQAVGSRWFRHRGGMPLFMSKPVSNRYLSFAEREEIGILRAQNFSVREIARRDGVCGLNVFGKFLAPATRAATIADARGVIADLELLTGSRRVAALGSDWDGGFTPLDCPEGLRHPGELAAFAGDLARSLNLDDAAIGAIRSGNWLRVLRATLPE